MWSTLNLARLLTLSPMAFLEPSLRMQIRCLGGDMDWEPVEGHGSESCGQWGKI